MRGEGVNWGEAGRREKGERRREKGEGRGHHSAQFSLRPSNVQQSTKNKRTHSIPPFGICNTGGNAVHFSKSSFLVIDVNSQVLFCCLCTSQLYVYIKKSTGATTADTLAETFNTGGECCAIFQN